MDPAWRVGRAAFYEMKQLWIPGWQLGEAFNGRVSAVWGRCWQHERQSKSLVVWKIMACAILNRKSNLDWGVSFIIIKNCGGWGRTCKSSSAKNKSAGYIPLVSAGWLQSEPLSVPDREIGLFITGDGETLWDLWFWFFCQSIWRCLEKLGELFLHSFF